MLPLLLLVYALQLVLLVEQLVNSCAASPALLQLLLQASRHTSCSDAPFAAWLAPLAIRTCCNCEPPAPVAMWAAVIQLAGMVSASAAAELAVKGLQVHPWSLQLWQLHYDTAGALELGALQSSMHCCGMEGVSAGAGHSTEQPPAKRHHHTRWLPALQFALLCCPYFLPVHGCSAHPSAVALRLLGGAVLHTTRALHIV
jgi:hypothetical protein